MDVSRHGVTQVITVGVASVAVTNPFAATTTIVRLASTTGCYIEVGGTPVASSADAYLPPNVIEYVLVAPGEKIAAIQASAGGFLTVTEVA